MRIDRDNARTIITPLAIVMNHQFVQSFMELKVFIEPGIKEAPSREGASWSSQIERG
jgi:hypothetical protein